MTQMTADAQFDLRNAQNIFSCGPFTAVGEEELLATLEDLGLCLDAEGGLGRVLRHADGLYLEVEGPAMRGTLLGVEDARRARAGGATGSRRKAGRRSDARSIPILGLGLRSLLNHVEPRSFKVFSKAAAAGRIGPA